MSKTTPNYEFIQPELSDPADITATNPNWDILDEVLDTLTIGYGTTDLTAGSSHLQTGRLYFVYE